MNGFNLDELKRISGGDPEFVKDMVVLFITQTESSLEDLDHCLASDHFNKLFEVLHKMKPSVRIMGMELIYSGILKIEAMKKLPIDREILLHETSILKENLKSILVDLKKHSNGD